jgi:hypothetical protein
MTSEKSRLSTKKRIEDLIKSARGHPCAVRIFSGMSTHSKGTIDTGEKMVLWEILE